MYNGNEKYSVVTDSTGMVICSLVGKMPKHMILCLNTNDKYNGCTAKDTITDTGNMPNNVDSQTGSAVVTTDKYNSNGNNSNTDSCTYFLV